MNGTALREALHEVASVGAGPVDDAQLARVADRAKGVEQVLTASRGGGRRRWVVGGLAVTAAAVLVAVGVAQALRPVEVTPASGPGSLPDQIFPSREHILTLEQAPIGRVSMVYTGHSVNGGQSSIAVGADGDEYRWVGRGGVQSPPNTAAVQVSPDGLAVAHSRSGDSGPAFAVEVVNASTGQSVTVLDGDDAPLGGEVETLAWSPDGDALFVSAWVVDKRLSATARRSIIRHYLATGLSGAASTDSPQVQVLAERLEAQMVGWSGGEPVLLVEKPTVLADPPMGRLDLVTLANEGPAEVVGRINSAASTITFPALSPDGTRFAALDDPTGSSSGDGKPWWMFVYDTQTGDVLREVRVDAEDFVSIVGWQDEETPVLFRAGPDRSGGVEVELVAFPPGDDDGRVLTDLSATQDDGNWVGSAAVAADILESGEVRVAEPPQQPWYDLRTLGPTVRDWVSEHTTLVVLAMVLLVGIGTAAVTRLSRRRSHRMAEVHG